MIVRIQELGDQLEAVPNDQEVPVEMITEFYNIFVPFFTCNERNVQEAKGITRRI